jgi:uncharacterized protein involved in type VI secretion and phage assembly
MDDAQQVHDLLDRVRGRYFGKYRGTAVEVDTASWRIRAKVPAVLGAQPTGWCMPCVPYAGVAVGFVFLPEVGAGVWVEFEGGDVSYPVWTGCYWRDGEQPSDAGPGVKAIVTKANHRLLLDDAGESITLTDPHQNRITLDSGGITVERGGRKVVVSDAEVSVNDGALEVT